MTEVKVRVESIRVDGRFRKDLGDIGSLAASMKRPGGLIHAITVTPDMRLLAGERRLAAARMLGWKEIDARVVDSLDDAADRLRVERDENTERKPMRPSELVALGKALEDLERPRADARKAASAHVAGRARHGLPATCPTEHVAGAGKTRDVVAAALGMSASTYSRAKTVVNAATDPVATDEEREIAQEALADMDSGATSITGAYERVIGHVRARVGAPTHATLVSARGQRRAISSAEQVLSGICHGLAQIAELHPEITDAEAAQWVGGLSESRRVITSLINRLKERTNAHA